jgi:hypothetical protein
MATDTAHKGMANWGRSQFSRRRDIAAVPEEIRETVTANVRACDLFPTREHTCRLRRVSSLGIAIGLDVTKWEAMPLLDQDES